MIPSIGIIQGIGKIVDYIKVFFSVITEWFENLPILDLWEDILPNDIFAVVVMVATLMITLAIIGIIRKLLIIFG